MPPTDTHVIVSAWNWMTQSALGAGILSGLFIWWFTQKRRKLTKHPHQILEEKLNDHIKDDDGFKAEFKGHLEKQWDVLMDLKSDTGKIKGKLGIL